MLNFFSRFWVLPALLLKKMVMGNFERGAMDSDIADSVDFMVDRVSSYNILQAWIQKSSMTAFYGMMNGSGHFGFGNSPRTWYFFEAISGNGFILEL
jgi:hypothetical protein